MLSIILPTYNEAANLPEMLRQIAAVTGMKDAEVIVVDDDSPDRTWEAAEGLKAQYPTLKVIRRIGRRGLSSAVTEGFAAAAGDVLMVMDADLQHDPAQIPALHGAMIAGADVAIASRFMERQPEEQAWSAGRRMLSGVSVWCARLVLRVRASDPMSGYFAVRRSVYEGMKADIRPAGFKILFDILSRLSRTARVADIPLSFRRRQHGSSKLSLGVALHFVGQMARIALMRMQFWLFWIIFIAAVAVLIPRAWALRNLYINPVLRQTVQYTLQRSADQQGWLLSELSVRRVQGNRVIVHRRAYHKGTDTVTCHELFYDDTPIQPCDSQ